MRRSKTNRYGSDALAAFDVYIVPLFLLGLGVVFIVLAFTISLPKTAELSVVRGHLDSFYHKQMGRGRDDYTTIVSLREGARFWTKAIDKEEAAKIFAQPGVEVRFYRERNPSHAPIDGAIKSYGLWVDGQQVESVESSLEHEKVLVRLGFPALGVFSATVAFFIYRRNKAKYVG